MSEDNYKRAKSVLIPVATEVPWWKVIGVGCLISISIEVLQFIFIRGFSEVDDVIHNTLGCAIGYGLYKTAKLACRCFTKRNRLVITA